MRNTVAALGTTLCFVSFVGACDGAGESVDEPSAGAGGLAAGAGGGSASAGRAGFAGSTTSGSGGSSGAAVGGGGDAGGAGSTSERGGSAGEAASAGADATGGTGSGGDANAGGTAGSVGNGEGGVNSAGAGGGGEVGGAPSGLVSCDPRRIVCRRAAPNCDEGDVPSVEGTCYGPCVAVELCECDEALDCPNENIYTCHRSAGHCGPYVR